MASTGDPPIHCPKCGQVHRRGFIVCEPFNERQGKPVGYEDDNDPRWPARCRGYLEGKRASDCLANVELARLRAEAERLRAALVWCYGGLDFSRKENREGWKQLCVPLLKGTL